MNSALAPGRCNLQGFDAHLESSTHAEGLEPRRMAFFGQDRGAQSNTSGFLLTARLVLGGVRMV
jgi:hypothetical protein